MKRVLTYYSFLITSFLATIGFLGVTSLPELLSALLFFPMAVYFLTQIMPEKSRKVEPETAELRLEKDEPINISDHNKRAFIKLIGSAGLSLFIFTLFARKEAQAAFFGSGGGPGIVGVKDSTGTLIDPSKHHPTDGYRIARTDDASSPAYYGFINKDGAWFITREESDGTYKYQKGAGSFLSTGWNIRNTTLTYADFDSIF